MLHAKKTQQDITTQLGSGSILPLIVRLSIPAVIAQLITFLYNIVDRMYVSRIENSGMDALAALGIVLPITLIIQAFANLVGLGGAPRAGIKLGEGDHPEANRIFNTAFSLLVLLGIFIGVVTFLFSREIVTLFGCPQSAIEFAVSYLKIYACGTVFVMLAQGLNPFILTQGYSMFAMSSVLLGAVINILLDPIFIFSLHMGVRGSSLATVISQLCSCVCVILFFLTKKSIFHFRIPEMRLSHERCLGILSLGITPFVMTITECAIQVVFNINLNRATGGNKDYTAALTVMLSALQLISLPLNGLGNGVQPFVSYNYGKWDTYRLKKRHHICHCDCLCFLYFHLVVFTYDAGTLRASVFSQRIRHGDCKRVLSAVFNGLHHVFCADDPPECQYRPGAGKTSADSCSDQKGHHLNSALFSSDPLPWL